MIASLFMMFFGQTGGGGGGSYSGRRRYVASAVRRSFVSNANPDPYASQVE